jgi:hypothetical protein
VELEVSGGDLMSRNYRSSTLFLSSDNLNFKILKPNAAKINYIRDKKLEFSIIE